MTEWMSYRPGDFILFSEQTYYRLFELYHQQTWPLHLAAFIFAALIIFSLWKKPHWAGRAIASILTISWLWIAWAFLYQRYYQIQVAANWFALIFVIQAMLMSYYGLFKNQFSDFVHSNVRISIAAITGLVGITIMPLILWLSGRQLEIVLITPDVTALATLAILLLLRITKLLYIIPVIWLLISMTTQWFM
jgi:hypothetical protein